MTCKELRLCFENPLRHEAERGHEAEHLAQCADCARFAEALRELAAGLRFAREAVPTVPASLDDAVLANYRKQMIQRPGCSASILVRRRFAVLCWTAVAAAVVLTGAILFFHGRRAFTSVTQPRPTQSTEVSQSSATPVVPSRISKPRPLHASAHRALRPSRTQSVATRQNPFPAGFRSLMYCDQLSCGGALEVIRMRLASPGNALAAASSSPDKVVFADVLVGPDGIARAIRIEE